MSSPAGRLPVTGDTPHVAVVGAGIVGICCALQMRAGGFRVSVFDPRPPGTATSFGNAGIVAVGSVIPYSTPGLWKTVPSMLFNRMSPLKLRAAYLHRISPWLVRFLSSGRLSRVMQISQDIAPLVADAREAHLTLVKDHAIDSGLLQQAGYLYVYRDERRFRESALHRQLLKQHQIRFDVLDANEIGQLEPGLSDGFRRGIYIPDGAFAVEPVALTRAYADAFQAAGGDMFRSSVRAFEFGSAGVTKIVCEDGIHDVDAVVVAAGAWSRKLAAMLGTRVPLDTERGYHLNVAWNDGITLNRPVIVGDIPYSISPMRDGVRITSGVEFGGLDLPPDFRRIRRVLADARRSLAGLGTDVNREWMGHRPSTPDSKPVIARSPRHANVFFAFGHGHLGLTLSAITGRVIRELMAGQRPTVPIEPFRSDRFYP